MATSKKLMPSLIESEKEKKKKKKKKSISGQQHDKQLIETYIEAILKKIKDNPEMAKKAAVIITEMLQRKKD